MSKVSKKKSTKKKGKKTQRHDPLEQQIKLANETGVLRVPKSKKGSKKGGQDKKEKEPKKEDRQVKKRKVGKASDNKAMDDDDDDDDKEVEGEADEDTSANIIPEKLTKKIFAQAKEQQEEVEEEDNGVPAARNVKSVWGAPPPVNRAKIPGGKKEEEDDEEHKEEEEENEGDEGDLGELQKEFMLHSGDVELGAEDEEALRMFMPDPKAPARSLADMIMEKIQEKEASGQTGGAAGGAVGGGGAPTRPASKIDPKVAEVYAQVGSYLRHYTSGKIPKAFKVIPNLDNWQELIILTDPEHWTPQATLAATRLFASNLNPKMAQRFYSGVLLPRARHDIETHKRLNFHIYAAIKKAIYKPQAFFQGILLPLCEDGCTPREAVIFASILQKCSIPMLHAAVAILKLSQLPYTGGTTLIIKTLLNKKYSLPKKVVDAICKWLISFETAGHDMPVIWHQTLLNFVQRYKTALTDKQKEGLKKLLKTQNHRVLTGEIRRELNASTVLDVTKLGDNTQSGPSSSAAGRRSAPMSRRESMLDDG